MKPMWEALEEFLFEWEIAGFDTFDSKTIDGWDGLPAGRTGSDLIQAYQEVMLVDGLEKPRTQYAIWRDPGTRTSQAKWKFKDWKELTLNDKRQMLQTFADDTLNRVTNWLTPVVEFAAAMSPKARKHLTKTLMGIGRLIQSLTELK